LHLITTNDTHFRWDSSEGGIGPSQRPLPDKTQDSQERETSMTTAGFEPAVPASGWPQTYALDRAALGSAPIFWNQILLSAPYFKRPQCYII